MLGHKDYEGHTLFYILIIFENPISILTCRGKGLRSPDWIRGRNQGEHDQNTGYEILKEFQDILKRMLKVG